MSKSTMERMLANDDFKENFESGYKEFLLDELLLAMMDGDIKSIRELAEEVGISKRIIQELKTGKQRDMRLSNFVNIAGVFGYHLDLVKGKKRLHLNTFALTQN